MPTRKNLTLILIALIAIIGVFAYVEYERSAPEIQHALVTKEEATLSVHEIAYSLTVVPGEKLINAMQRLVATSEFTFTGRDYPGIGFFVDAINEKKNANGMYWILYINGVVATTGVSATVVNAGDRIEWKYEKGY